MTKDKSGQAIQCLTDDISVAPGKIAVTAASANVAIPAGSLVVRIANSTNCYYRWGSTNGVTASVTDRFLPVGTEIKTVPVGMTYIAAIRDTADGVLTIDAQI